MRQRTGPESTAIREFAAVELDTERVAIEPEAVCQRHDAQVLGADRVLPSKPAGAHNVRATIAAGEWRIEDLRGKQMRNTIIKKLWHNDKLIKVIKLLIKITSWVP